MEWEGMIVNAGLRFDMWYLGEKYKRIKSGGMEEWYHFEDDEKFQLMVSPRFGISHPISDKSVVHFAYNYQNQFNKYQSLFITYLILSDSVFLLKYCCYLLKFLYYRSCHESTVSGL